MKSLLLIFLMIYSFSVFAIDSRWTESQYYPDLSFDDQYELQVIMLNYHRYSDQLKKIAYRRAEEIRTKMLPLETRLIIYNNVINNIASNEGIDENLRNVIATRQQAYLSLPQDVQKELLKFNMGFISQYSLSDVAKDYLAGRNLLINDNK